MSHECQMPKWGGCCCQCQYQEKIGCHPWNKFGPFKGKISEYFGYGCTVFMAMRETGEASDDVCITFSETKHGMCEMFTPRVNTIKEKRTMIREVFLERIINGTSYQCGMHKGKPVVAYSSDGETITIVEADCITQARTNFWTLVKKAEAQ